jgi:type III pantothenate kinase
VRFVVSIGNTNIVHALFRGQNLLAVWRIAVENRHTTDEFMLAEQNFLKYYGFGIGDVDDIILSSVVPSQTLLLKKACEELFDRPVAVLNEEVYSLLPFQVVNPQEVGADLIANVMGCYDETNFPLVIVDFGTALSFTVVDSSGQLSGVAIAPGLNMAMQALSGNTGQLSAVPLIMPQRVSGRTTEEALQAGVVKGFMHLCRGLLDDIADELGEKPCIIATGGLGLTYKEFLGFNRYEPDLVLKGLNNIGMLIKTKRP